MIILRPRPDKRICVGFKYTSVLHCHRYCISLPRAWVTDYKPQTLESLDDFLYWLEYDYERETDNPQDVNLAQIKELVNLFLERDEARIKAGENELMEQWIKACKGGTK